jgi:hypothetical protein
LPQTVAIHEANSLVSIHLELNSDSPPKQNWADMTTLVILVELESDSTKLIRYISEQSMMTKKPNLQQGHREIFKKKLNPKPKEN